MGLESALFKYNLMNFAGVQGSKVQGFKVPFSFLDCIWDAYLREKRQLRQT